MQILKNTVVGALVVGGMLALAPAKSAVAAEVTLRFHQFLPPVATIPRLAIKPWIEAVEKASDGEIEIQQFDAMALGGKPPGLFDQAKDGVVDIVWTVLGYTPGRFPKTEVFELPFMTKDATGGSKAIEEFVQTQAADEFDDVKLVCAHTHGPGLFHTDEPIRKLEDLKGMKIRGGSRVINDLLKKLGAIPVGMPITKVGESLSKGIIDGTTIPWEVVPAFKVQQLVKNHTEFEAGTALYTSTFGVVMNKAKYETLSPSQKKAIDDHSGMYCAELFGKAMDAGDKGSKAMVKKAGNNIYEIQGDEMDRWRAAAQTVTKDWIESADKEGLDGQALVDAARSLVDKYSN
jgi:TRAP-type C4-dicarboxylate transport system substrate-binding protein